MPVLKHARKKLKQDKKRTIQNAKYRKQYKLSVKNATAKKSKDSVSKAYKDIDKAVKVGLLHKNKAARMKSSLAKLISTKPALDTKKATEKETKTKVVKSKKVTKPTPVVKKKKSTPKKSAK